MSRIALHLVLVSLAALSACRETAVPSNTGDRSALPARNAEPEWAPEDGRSLFDFITDLAAERSRTGYTPLPSRVRATPADTLSYDAYRAIQFRDEAPLWRADLPFAVHLDHPGGLTATPIDVVLVSPTGAQLLRFDSARFDYGRDTDPAQLNLGAEAGFGGLRILARMNRPDHLDEVLSFRGASYFRLIGPDQVYGTSARGVALNTAQAEPEEFPDFVKFWVQQPEPGDSVLVVHALLDGPSITGAYRFELTAGSGASVEGERRPSVLLVMARLYARRTVPRLGVAPLTSMYLHGALRATDRDVMRPRVHDAELLVMATHAGEMIVRPLSNREQIRVTSLRDRDPRGFGLAQPERGFDAFLDLEAEYHRRPGLWVEPVGAWGDGGVMLAELPTASEFADNIVAFWAPDDTLEAGARRDFVWRLITFDVRPETTGPTLGVVQRARVGQAGLPGERLPPPPQHRRVFVDFVGAGLAALPEGAALEPVLHASTGVVRDLRVEVLPNGGRRATWILEGEAGIPSDMRLFLRSASGRTETWSYLFEIPAGAADKSTR